MQVVCVREEEEKKERKKERKRKNTHTGGLRAQAHPLTFQPRGVGLHKGQPEPTQVRKEPEAPLHERKENKKRKERKKERKERKWREGGYSQEVNTTTKERVVCSPRKKNKKDKKIYIK